MEKKNKKALVWGASLLAAFVLWTVLVCFVDVQAIGSEGSSVGFAALNGYVHDFTGVNMSLYVITDWLGLVPIGVAFGFAVLGLVQWIKGKSLLKVDRSILVLGGFYIVVMAVYILFEVVVKIDALVAGIIVTLEAAELAAGGCVQAEHEVGLEFTVRGLVGHLPGAFLGATGADISRGRTLPLCVPATLKLVGGSGAAPEKIFRKTHLALL